MSRANEPAYPIGSGDMRDPTGLTLREHYAGLAMQGILANNVYSVTIANSDKSKTVSESIAGVAVLCADALIAALEAK